MQKFQVPLNVVLKESLIQQEEYINRPGEQEQKVPNGISKSCERTGEREFDSQLLVKC